MGRRVNLVRPNGVVVSVPAESVRDLLRLGYRAEAATERADRFEEAGREADFSGWDQQALAALEGAAAGATLGISDQVIKALGTGYELEGRAERYGKTRIGSEIVGAVIPAILSGGSSGLGSAARVLPAGMLGAGAGAVGRAVGGGLRGAVTAGALEGAVGGIGSEVSRAAITGDPITTESLFASAGIGGLLGLGGGAAGYGLERGAGKLAGLIRPSRVEDEVLAAGQRMAAPVEPGAYDVPRAPGAYDVAPQPGRIRGRAAYGSEAMPAFAGTSASDVRASVATQLVPVADWKRLRQAVDDLEPVADKLGLEVLDAHTDLKAHMASLNRAADEAHAAALAKASSTPSWVDTSRNLMPEMAEDVRVMRRAAADALKSEDPIRAAAHMDKYRASIERLSSAVAGSGTPGIELPGALARKASSSVGDLAEFGRLVRAAKAEMPRHPTEFFVMGEERAEKVLGTLEAVLRSGVPEGAAVRAQLEGVLGEMVDKVGVAPTGPVMDRLRTTWAAGRQAVRQAGDAADFRRLGVDPRGDLVDLPAELSLAGLEEVSSPEGAALAARAEVGGPRAQPKPPKPPKPEKAPKEVPAPEPERSAFGDAARSMAGAAVRQLARRAAGAVIGGAVGAQIGGGNMWGGMLAGTVLATRASTMLRVAQSAARLGVGAGRAGQHAGLGGSILRSLTGLPDRGSKRKEAVADRSAELREMLVTGRDRAFELATELSAAGHPELGQAAYKQAVAVMEVLDRVLPRNPPGTRWGDQHLWTLPPERQALFAQELQAATAPLDFLDAATLDPAGVFPEAVAVLAEAYPTLYGEFQGRALERLAETGTAGYSESDLRALSKLVGVALVPSMTPEFVVAQASMYQKATEEAAEAQKNLGSGPTQPPGRPPGNNPEASPAQRRVAPRG